MKCVFVIDDEANVRHLLELLLRDAGFDVRAFGSPAEALTGLGARPPDLIISDQDLADEMNGVELIGKLREAAGQPVLPAMLLTGNVNSWNEGDEPEMAGVIVLRKPFGIVELQAQVERLLGVNAC